MTPEELAEAIEAGDQDKVIRLITAASETDRRRAAAMAIRLKRDLFDRSYLGGMVTHRSGPGVDGVETGFGVDGDFPLVVADQNVQPAFWLAGSRATGTSSTPIAWRASLDYPNDLFDNFVSVSRIDSAFNPALGFVRRTGILQSTGSLRYRPRPPSVGSDRRRPPTANSHLAVASPLGSASR